MNAYLLSIIIPTKDRYQYLKECLKTIVDINSDQVEIIVQDNTKENSEIIKYIEALDWEHIKYFYTSEPLTQTENSEKAVMNSTGEYVCYIGDDDSVSEIIVDVVQVLRKYNIDSCNVNMAGYYWPDVKFSKNRRAPLSFDTRRVNVKKIDTKKVFKKYLKSGMQEMLLLPRLYHGIISRKVLDEIKNISGSYFPGPSPDMANASVAALVLDWHLMIKLPIIISGTAHNSAAGKGISGTHKGKLSGVSQIASDTEEKWDHRIPKLWLGNTIWPESCLKALEQAKAIEYSNLLNFYPIYARIGIKHREYIPLVREHLSTPIDYLMTIYEGTKDIVRWSIRKLFKVAREKLNFEYICKDDISLTEACLITNKHNKAIDNIEIISKQIEKKVNLKG